MARLRPITLASVILVAASMDHLNTVGADKLSFIYTARVMSQSYPWIAQEAGLFKKHDLEVPLIFVTADAQRTMQTFLGATTQLGPEDLNMDYITSAKVLYLEGYLWDQPRAKNAMREAAIKAKDAGGKVSLTLSDAFCVDRYRDEFLELAEKYVDILFANESEILSLYQANQFDDALQQVRTHCEIAALTRSEKGSVVVNGHEVHVIDAEKGVTVVDTTGAGDAYAAGFLYAYTQGYDLATCGKLGGIMAAEVISHFGPRPEADVKALAGRVL